jgi:matrixin
VVVEASIRARWFQRAAALGLALGCFGVSRPALAFCRSMSCELGEDPANPCARDLHSCVSEGQPLHWGSACLDYAVQVDGSPNSGLDADQVQGLVAEAFAVWQSAECPGGGTPRFQAQFQGYVACDRHEAVCGGAAQNVNVVMLHDSGWPYGITKLGVTTPSGGVNSGLVVDADVELNAEDYDFRADDANAVALRYVVTHELGHFLGLAHSDVNGALMTAGYQSMPLEPGLLSADDIAAICAVYPPGPALSCAGPASPAYDACATVPGAEPKCQLASIPQGNASGCSCRAAPRGRAMPAALGLAALLLIARGRRGARKPRSCIADASL